MPSIWTTSKSRPERETPSTPLRAADSATKRREAADFDSPAPAGAGTPPSGSRTESGKLARRDVDQHLVHGPLAEPVFRNRRLPARHRPFLSVKAAKRGPLDFDLPAVEADLAPRCPPAVRLPLMTACMAWTTDCLGIVIHHLAKSLHAGSQAKQLEARRNVRQGLKLQRSRRNRGGCGISMHGVAFLCGISTPSLTAQGEQRRFSYFNIDRDNSRLWSPVA